ncbi:MAG: MFS transporter, partial [Alphaproteobacteria bacterium]|nr:MFS transporter [Alphaproteobacteria bacterium]
MVQAALSPARAGLSRLAVLLLLCGLVLTICTGLRQSFGLFLTPMSVLGISSSAYSFAIALQAIVWGLSQPFIGMLADRYGSRPVIVTSALVFAAGLALMGMTDGALGLDVGGGLLVGTGIAGTGLGVVVGMVSRAVPAERRSQTVGLVAALGSLGTFVLAPLGGWMIDALGWRGALFGFAGVAAAMAVLARPLREPDHAGRTTGEPQRSIGATLRLAARHPGFRA